METLIELERLGCQILVIVMVLMFVPLAIYDVVSSRRKGDSWKTIFKRYL
jgi:hypothetical protein